MSDTTILLLPAFELQNHRRLAIIYNDAEQRETVRRRLEIEVEKVLFNLHLMSSEMSLS